MKRVISILIIFALTISLFACGGAAVPTENEQNEQNQLSQTAASAEEPTAEPAVVEATPEPMPETTLAEADWGNLTAVSITEDGQGGYHFAFSLKNMLDIGITATVNIIFNGWLVPDALFSASADPKTETAGEIEIPAEFFALCGIETVTEIKLRYTLRDQDYKVLAKDVTMIYPAGEEAAKNAAAYQYVPKESDVLLFESEDAILFVTSLAANHDSGVSMTFYFENTSDKDLILNLYGFGANEYAFPYGYLSPTIMPGTRVLVSRSIDATSLASAGVDEVTRVDVGYALINSDDYSELTRGSMPMYPSGVETPRVERTPVEGELVLVDNKDFAIIITGCLNNPGSSHYGLSIYAENKTDKEVSIQVQNAEVNGEPCMSNSTIADLPAGMRINMIYTWNIDAFEKAGLTKDTVVEKLTLPIIIYSDGNRRVGSEVYKHTFKVNVW